MSRTRTSGSFVSVRLNACVHRLDIDLSSHPKEFWGNGVQTHINSKGKISSTRNILPIGGSNPRCCIKQESKPNTLPTTKSGPLSLSKSSPAKISNISSLSSALYPPGHKIAWCYSMAANVSRQSNSIKHHNNFFFRISYTILWRKYGMSSC